MKPNEKSTDAELIELLRQNNEAALDMIFRRHYSYLCKAVYRIVPNPEILEDFVQDVFFELWKRREGLMIHISVKAYLKRAVINKALNYIRRQKMKAEKDLLYQQPSAAIASSQQQLEASELQELLNKAIQTLPERCRLVFTLSRYEELSYKEISEKLEISVKTVENQISKALKVMRKAVAPYMSRTSLLLLFFLF